MNCKETIWFVDDEIKLAELCKEELEPNYHVVNFLSAEHALRTVKERSMNFKQPQIIITDFHMPGMDGLTLVNELRGKKIESHFILITGFSDKRIIQQAFDQNIFGFLEKPFEISKLKELIGRGLANQALNEINNQIINKVSHFHEPNYFSTSPHDLKTLLEKREFLMAFWGKAG